MINIFDPRILDQVVSVLPSRGGFFRDTFFTRRVPREGTKFDVDFYKGKRRIAPFVNPKSAGKTVSKLGYKTNTFETPLLKPKDITTVEDLSIRVAGEAVYGSGMTKEDRALMMLTEKLSEFNEMNIRREELMASQAMLTGKIPVIGEGVNYEIDFEFTNKEALLGTDKWNDPASDPLADIERWIIECRQKGYRTPNICLMARDAYQAFINHPKVQAVLDLKNMTIAVIQPSMLSENVSYGGTIAQWNLSIYIYDEWYIDDWTDPSTPVEKPIVPNGTVMLASNNAKTTIYYGEIVFADETAPSKFRSYIAERAAQTWIQKDPAARFIELQSRPLPVPHEVDSWYVATVL